MAEPFSANRVLIVGRHSFLACSLQEQLARDRYHAISHEEARSVPIEDFDVVVNFALHPELRSQPYNEELDLDWSLANRLHSTRAKYVMLSSRKVYSPDSQWQAEENALLSPSDNYGRNKLETEDRLTSILGDRLTILRIANAFGNEQRLRRSFMSLMMNSLAKDRKVILDISPETRRDFIPNTRFGQMLATVVNRPVPGVFNLGSGIATPVGQIAQWVIEGHGCGEIEVTDNTVRDEFVLNIDKWHREYGESCTESEIRQHCLNIGKDIEPS